MAAALESALAAHDLRAVIFFAQNDGTLMALDYAVQHPVLTIGSGPANSIRGAAYLTGASDTLVADVGGTSTDVGVLVNGFPRESSRRSTSAACAPTSACPTWSRSRSAGQHRRGRRAGAARRPGQRRLPAADQALVFGGSTATLTDAAVACGRLELGDPAPATARRGELERAMRRADEMLADAIDRIKTARGEAPLVVVGGGGPLVPDRVPGISEVVRPPNHDVANAIGAAIASRLRPGRPHLPAGAGRALGDARQARQIAHDEAVRAGADPDRSRSSRSKSYRSPI